MNRRSRLPAILTVASIAALVVPTALADPTSERYAFSTYRQQAGRVTVYADGYPASMGGDASYIPVSVAIAMTKGGTRVAFTPESFTLLDGGGQSFPAAGFDELARAYDKLSFDRSLVRMRPIEVGSYVADLREVESRFYPPVNGGTRIPRVELGPYTWFNDVLYFPRPPAGLGGVLTLRVAIPGAVPVDVRFEVPRKAPEAR